jgi:hypothetical protein
VIFLAGLALLPGCGDDGGDPLDALSPREQVVDTVGRYLGAINMGDPRATCAMFAQPLRVELEARGGAPCAKLYAAGGVNRGSEAPGLLDGRLPGITPRAVRIDGNRAEIHGVQLQRASGRWLIVGGLPDDVARALPE